MFAVDRQQQARVSASLPVGSTDNVELSLRAPGFGRNTAVLLRRLRIRFLSGSAAQYQPVVLSVDESGALSNQLSIEHVAPAAVAVADSYDSGTVDVPTMLQPKDDGSVSLWVRPVPDAGVDNVFEIVVDYLG